jgi:hypothetical protein
MTNIKTNIGNLFMNNTGLFKIIGAVIFTAVIVVICFKLFTVTFASNEDEIENLKVGHQKVDQQLLSHFDGWVQANGMRQFCLPKADLLVQEIDLRTKLGDDVSDLQARLDRVTNECNEVVKQVLFR